MTAHINKKKKYILGISSVSFDDNQATISKTCREAVGFIFVGTYFLGLKKLAPALIFDFMVFQSLHIFIKHICNSLNISIDGFPNILYRNNK